MIELRKCCGDFIRQFTPQEEQAYNALYKWATRLNKWEYSSQLKMNKGKRLKRFIPNSTSLVLIENMKKIGTDVTSDEAMSLLFDVSIRTELNLCIEAGF